MQEELKQDYPAAGLMHKKESSSQQLKKQRLARDILLSKVYNSSQLSQQALSTSIHKKTNTAVSVTNGGAAEKP